MNWSDQSQLYIQRCLWLLIENGGYIRSAVHHSLKVEPTFQCHEEYLQIDGGWCMLIFDICEWTAYIWEINY